MVSCNSLDQYLLKHQLTVKHLNLAATNFGHFYEWAFLAVLYFGRFFIYQKKKKKKKKKSVIPEYLIYMQVLHGDLQVIHCDLQVINDDFQLFSTLHCS